MIPDLHTREEAAKILGISISMIDNLRYAKKIRFYRIGGKVRFSNKDLEDFLEKNHALIKLERIRPF